MDELIEDFAISIEDQNLIMFQALVKQFLIKFEDIDAPFYFKNYSAYKAQRAEPNMTLMGLCVEGDFIAGVDYLVTMKSALNQRISDIPLLERVESVEMLYTFLDNGFSFEDETTSPEQIPFWECLVDKDIEIFQEALNNGLRLDYASAVGLSVFAVFADFKHGVAPNDEEMAACLCEAIVEQKLVTHDGFDDFVFGDNSPLWTNALMNALNTQLHDQLGETLDAVKMKKLPDRINKM